MRSNDCSLDLKQRLNNPGKYSGYKVTTIPSLCKKCQVHTVKTEHSTPVDCTEKHSHTACSGPPTVGAQEVVINDYLGYYCMQKLWGREYHEDTRQRFGITKLNRNDFPILDSVKG